MIVKNKKSDFDQFEVFDAVFRPFVVAKKCIHELVCALGGTEAPEITSRIRLPVQLQCNHTGHYWLWSHWKFIILSCILNLVYHSSYFSSRYFHKSKTSQHVNVVFNLLNKSVNCQIINQSQQNYLAKRRFRVTR